jgi:uncharacterized protein (TIGR03000 family)
VQRAEAEVKQARELVEQDLLALGQTRGAGNLIALLARPQEVVAAIQMLQQAYLSYFTAVADYNRAQFQVYRALGNPAQTLLDDPRCGSPGPPPAGAGPAPQAPDAVQKPPSTAAAVVQAAGGRADPGPARACPGGTENVRPGYYSEAYTDPAGANAVANNKALIRVRLPAGAELWIGGEKIVSGDTVREFATPELNPERVYCYPVRARWVEDGFTVEKSLQVRTMAGTRVTVNLVQPAAARPPRPAAPPSRIEFQPRDWTTAGAAPAR